MNLLNFLILLGFLINCLGNCLVFGGEGWLGLVVVDLLIMLSVLYFSKV